MNLTSFIKSFSRDELRDIILSVLVLGFLFSLSNFTATRFLFSIFIVGLAFVLHELGHRYMALDKGFEARYVAWPTGLMLSLVFGIISGGRFIFAAPGAVVIGRKISHKYKYPRITREDYGRIALAGPFMNIVLAFILSLFVKYNPLIMYGVYINLFLAIFNLLPIPPLDGSKVFFWSRAVWLMTFIFLLLAFIFFETVASFLYSIYLLIISIIILFGGIGYKPF